MDEFRRKALLKKFPFLGDKYFMFDPDYVRIKRIDKELLEKVPYKYDHDGSLAKTSYGDRIHLVLKGGKVMEEVNYAGHYSSNYAYTPTSEWGGERVIDFIYRHGISPSNIEAIVLVEWDYKCWEGRGETIDEKGITVYLPKEDIVKVISTLEERAEIEVKNELESC
jgi:hypothetical protein